MTQAPQSPHYKNYSRFVTNGCGYLHLTGIGGAPLLFSFDAVPGNGLPLAKLSSNDDKSRSEVGKSGGSLDYNING